MSDHARQLFQAAGVALFIGLLGIIAFGGPDRTTPARITQLEVAAPPAAATAPEATPEPTASEPEGRQEAAILVAPEPAERNDSAETADPNEVTGLLEELVDFELGPIEGDPPVDDSPAPAPPAAPTPVDLPPVQFGSGEEQEEEPSPTPAPPTPAPAATPAPTAAPQPTATATPSPTPTPPAVPAGPVTGYLNPQPGVNVGIPNGTALVEVGPNDGGEYVITEDNAVIDGLRINACVEVRAANVTIRNSHLICDTLVRDFERYPVDVKAGASLTIEWSLIECVPQGTTEPCPNGGIWGRDITAVRNEIRNVSDAFNPLGGTWVFRENYVHDQVYACASYQPDGQSHADAIQAFGGNGTIEGNYIQGWRGDINNSCDPSAANANKGFQGIYVSSESWNDASVPNVVIRNNLFSGFQHNSIYCFGGADRSVCNVENNTFERRTDRQFTLNIGVGSSRCNRWADSSLMQFVDVVEESDPAGC